MQAPAAAGTTTAATAPRFAPPRPLRLARRLPLEVICVPSKLREAARCVDDKCETNRPDSNVPFVSEVRDGCAVCLTCGVIGEAVFDGEASFRENEEDQVRRVEAASRLHEERRSGKRQKRDLEAAAREANLKLLRQAGQTVRRKGRAVVADVIKQDLTAQLAAAAVVGLPMELSEEESARLIDEQLADVEWDEPVCAPSVAPAAAAPAAATSSSPPIAAKPTRAVGKRLTAMDVFEASAQKTNNAARAMELACQPETSRVDFNLLNQRLALDASHPDAITTKLDAGGRALTERPPLPPLQPQQVRARARGGSATRSRAIARSPSSHQVPCRQPDGARGPCLRGAR